ncbi:site-specific integrase [Listeria booriae]|nr:site-specific integrase [Listeria booriae]
MNFYKQELTVNKTTKRHNSTTFEVGKPKTESSIRTINLDDFTISKLREWEAYQKKYIFQKGLEKSQYVFVSKHKKAEPPHYRAILKNYKARLNELNLEQIGIHGLRHTHAVMLLEAGASIKYVAERLGHSNVEMTLNVYVHLTEKMKQDDMNKFVNHMGLG